MVTTCPPDRALLRPLKDGVDVWRVLVADEPTAAGQMALDEALAHRGEPVLRLFRWGTPAFSFGYRQSPPPWAQIDRCRAVGAEVVERPTGGALAVHGSDLSCSVTIPLIRGMTLEWLMQHVCESFAAAVDSYESSVRWIGGSSVSEERAGVPGYVEGVRGGVSACLTTISPYGLMVGSRKLCGFSVRRLRASWLVQGSMLVDHVPGILADLMPAAVRHAFKTRAISLGDVASRIPGEEELRAAIVTAWAKTWGVPCVETTREASVSVQAMPRGRIPSGDVGGAPGRFAHAV